MCNLVTEKVTKTSCLIIGGVETEVDKVCNVKVSNGVVVNYYYNLNGQTLLFPQNECTVDVEPEIKLCCDYLTYIGFSGSPDEDNLYLVGIRDFTPTAPVNDYVTPILIQDSSGWLPNRDALIEQFIIDNYALYGYSVNSVIVSEVNSELVSATIQVCDYDGTINIGPVSNWVDDVTSPAEDWDSAVNSSGPTNCQEVEV